jgi:hypothetical protein
MLMQKSEQPKFIFYLQDDAGVLLSCCFSFRDQFIIGVEKIWSDKDEVKVAINF